MSRKYVHDYYARNCFLDHIMQKNAEVRNQMDEGAKISAVEEQVFPFK